MSRRLVFMGSDPIAIPALEWIWTSARDVAGLVAVYTQPDRPSGRGQKVRPGPIKQWADEKGVPVFQPEKLTPELLPSLAGFAPDASLVMAYGHLLKKDWIETPKYGTWNIHTSLLPHLRGASPIQAAIAHGDAETGACLMRMVVPLDAGPVLDEEKVAIDRLETGGSLEAKLAEACVPLLERSLAAIFQSDPPVRPQDDSRATFTRKLRKSDGGLDFNVPAAALARRVNALNPWPGAHFELGREQIRVGLADHHPAGTDSCATPGTVVSANGNSLVVATSAGLLTMLRLQRPGGRMIDAGDFLRGHPVKTGTILSSAPMPELVAPRPFK